MKKILSFVYRYFWWLASGILLAFSFPPNSIPFLGYFALIPAIYRSYKDGYVSVIFGSLVLALFFWGLTIDWFSSFHPLAPIGIIIPLYLYTMVPFVVFSSIVKNFNEDGILIFPFLWVGMELLRGNGFWSLPLIYLAHTQYHFALSDNQIFSFINGSVPSFAQSFGVFGVSFIVALFNSLILIFVLKILSGKANISFYSIAMVVVFIFILSGLGYFVLKLLAEFSYIWLSGVIIFSLISILLFISFGRLWIKKFLVISLSNVFKLFYPIILIVSFVVIGGKMFLDTKYAYENLDSEIIRFGLLQPNFSPWDKLFAKDFGKLDEVIELYVSASKKSDIVIGCESILRDPVNYYYKYNDRFGVEAMSIGKKVKKPIILTYPHMEIVLTNTFVSQGGKLRQIIQEIYEYYNSALFFDKNGVQIARYDKVHTVPFGEWTPFSEYIPALRETINAIVGGDLTPGREFIIVPIEIKPSVIVNLGPNICFEDLYPYISRKLKRKGADIIVNMTNDGWANSVKSQWQHLVGAMYRAIETGLVVIRATNTGRTAVILPYGRIISTIDDFTKGFMVAEVKLVKIPTLFSSIGEYGILLFVFIGNCFVVFFSILKGLKLKSVL